MSSEIELWRDIETVEVEAPIDVVVQVRDRIDNFLRLAKQMKATCDERIIAWAKAHGGSITVGDTVTKVVRSEKHEKPRDKSHLPIVEAAFEAAAGDMALVAGLIASDGVKPGALKRLVGQERFDELMETTWRDVLKDGVKSEKLVTVNKNFVNT